VGEWFFLYIKRKAKPTPHPASGVLIFRGSQSPLRPSLRSVLRFSLLAPLVSRYVDACHLTARETLSHSHRLARCRSQHAPRCAPRTSLLDARTSQLACNEQLATRSSNRDARLRVTRWHDAWPSLPPSLRSSLQLHDSLIPVSRPACLRFVLQSRYEMCCSCSRCSSLALVFFDCERLSCADAAYVSRNYRHHCIP
jgi:hypothetical protein